MCDISFGFISSSRINVFIISYTCTLSVFFKRWWGYSPIVAFIEKIVFIGMWPFLILWFVLRNILMELISVKTSGLFKEFFVYTKACLFFYIPKQECIQCVCMCVCVYSCSHSPWYNNIKKFLWHYIIVNILPWNKIFQTPFHPNPFLLSNQLPKIYLHFQNKKIFNENWYTWL